MIILCRSDEREHWVADFYRLKGAQAVEETYNVKLEALEHQSAATAQERDRLLRERDDARKQVDEWARQAAERTPDEVGGIYREALHLFIEGKTDAALQLLSDDRLQQETDQAKDQLDQAKQRLEQVVQGWLLRAQLLTSKFDYEGAKRAYEKAVTSAPGSAVAWVAYAHFHGQQNHFAQARRGYEQALALARLASKDAAVAGILRNLGNLSRAENRNAEARQQYQEALALFRGLAHTNPAVYLPHVARTLTTFGMLDQAENRHAEARQQFEEALGIFRQFAARAPATYQPLVQALEQLIRGLP